MGLDTLGKLLLFLGLLIMIGGALLLLAGRIPWLGHMPGDIHVQRDGFSCTFPLVTSIIVSIVLTVLLNIIIRVLNR
jgi:hypothetical protein